MSAKYAKARPSDKAPEKPTVPDMEHNGNSGAYRVRAKQDGFFGGQRIRKGMTFTVRRQQDLALWMELVDASTPDDVAARYAPRRRGGRQQAVQSTDFTTAMQTTDPLNGAEKPAETAAPASTEGAPTGAQDVLN